jgi:flagellar protein FliS
MMTYGQNQYRKAQVAAVDRGHLIVLLYEEAISFLSKTRACQSEGDISPPGCSRINRCQDILDEFSASLNMEYGGDIAINLHQPYLFYGLSLVKAKIKNDPRPVQEVVHLLSSLNEA